MFDVQLNWFDIPISVCSFLAADRSVYVVGNSQNVQGCTVPIHYVCIHTDLIKQIRYRTTLIYSNCMLAVG